MIIPPALFLLVRRAVYSAALVWAAFLFYHAANSFPTIQSSFTYLTRMYGLTAIYVLFTTLLPGLIAVYFPRFILNSLLIRARRALGVSAFFFASLHAILAFTYNLGGSVGSWWFLSSQSQWALFFSSTAYVILLMLAATSFDVIERRLGHANWKRLHRLVYIATIAVVFHAFFIGSHFTDAKSWIPRLTNAIYLLLIFLEVGATIVRLRQQKMRFSWRKNIAVYGGLVAILLFGVIASTGIFSKGYDPHALHRQGYSRNYEVSVVTNPTVVTPNQPVTMRIKITDKRTHKIVKKFQILQEKLMHLIVLSDDLTYYNHIHPELTNEGKFLITTSVPREGKYRLYIEYSPPDFTENLSMVPLSTAHAPANEQAHLNTTSAMSILTDGTKVQLSPAGPFNLSDTPDLIFNFTDSSGKPIVDLESYLAAFGHLAVVSEDGSVYTHVHPIDIPISKTQVGGPIVRFSTFFQKKGKYKLFLQFQRRGQLSLATFVIEVK